MDYIILEHKLNSVIYGYLSEKYYPDYGWDSHENYEKYVNRWGNYEFEVNDVLSYHYVKGVKKNDTLIVYDNIKNDLTSWFGDFWKPVFVKWFENHTGLKVDHFEN